MPGLRIEIGVAASSIHRSMPYAEVRQTARIYMPTGTSPSKKVIQLLTPLFQRSAANG